MKSNKGITIITLIIYVIALTVVIGTASMLMRYFYRNADETLISKDSTSQYSRFLAYITDDINSRQNR